MNSTLKPVSAAVPQSGQASPAKANIAGVNHAGHPQGAQKGNNQPGNPSLAPVSANMAQMAQNMSHHGNLSLMGQNSVTPTNSAASPSKSASAPLSLVQDKVTSSQPLALTRTPEKNTEASLGQSNGTVDSPKSASSTPNVLKPQNPEPEKKQDIAKTSPSTPKPPEKPNTTSSTPQRAETSNIAQVMPDSSSHPKVATANEPSEKSPAKPIETKPTAADVAPTQTEAKPVPESANDMSKVDDCKAEKVAKIEEPKPVEDKVDGPAKAEKSQVEKDKIDEKKPVTPAKDDKKVESSPKQETTEKSEIKKAEDVKPIPSKIETKAATKPTMKLATVTPPLRKRRQVSGNKELSLGQKPAEGESTPGDSRSKRNRIQVQLYQSPTPELTMATKLSASAGRSTPTKNNDDKLIVFYKNEYLAVRNAEGGFYVCQSVQNVYRTTRKIKIRWLSQDKAADPTGETYKPDFYDITDMECVLTTLNLSRAPSGGGSQILTAAEAARAKSILERALKHEQGQNTNNMELTEEHPDGLDLSLYTDESQLEKKSRKRNASKSSPKTKPQDDSDDDSEEQSPSKRTRTSTKRSPKSARKQKSPKSSKKRKSTGSTPNVAPASKVGIVRRIYRNTATAVTEKPSPAKTRTLAKRTPAKVKEVPTPLDKGAKTPKRSTRDSKASPIIPTPTTSGGKSTRTPRKPPAKK